MRMGVLDVGARLLRADNAGPVLAGPLRERVRRGRAQLGLVPPRAARSGREMGAADAAGVRLRGEGEPLPDAHEATDGPGARRRALRRVDRAARREREARPGDLAAARELPPRRRAPRPRLEAG